MTEVAPRSSAEADLVVGLDVSTHGAKAIAWRLDGSVAAGARAPYALRSPRSGYYEQDAEDWSEAGLRVLTQVVQQAAGCVRAVGITHQRETFVGIDDQGRPLMNAIVWMDERAVEATDRLRKSLGEETFLRVSGKPLSVTPSISKIAWLREQQPELFARVSRWCDVQAFLVRRWTGQDCTSVGSADPMGLVDLGAAQWSAQLLRAVGLDARQLAALRPNGSVAGALRPELAARTGLEPTTPIVMTAGDGQVAAVGAQVLDGTRAYLNLGTAIVSGTVVGALQVDRAFRAMSGALAGSYLLESDLKGGTFTIDWMCERLLGVRQEQLATIEQRARALAPGADGLMLLPYFAGVMNPYWDDNASGVLVGLRGVHGPAHLYRAILEGIGFEQRLHLEAIEAAAHVHIAEVRVLGGGANSELWCQVLADVLQRNVVRTRSAEATSLGAAMLSAAAVGLFPDARAACEAMGGTGKSFAPSEQASRYDRLYREVYLGLYPSLRTALGRLAVMRREA